jgi:hypothetical protein
MWTVVCVSARAHLIAAIVLLTTASTAAGAPKVLIVYHSETGHTRTLATAIATGATQHGAGEVRVLSCGNATYTRDVLWADAIVVGKTQSSLWLSLSRALDMSVDVLVLQWNAPSSTHRMMDLTFHSANPLTCSSVRHLFALAVLSVFHSHTSPMFRHLYCRIMCAPTLLGSPTHYGNPSAGILSWFETECTVPAFHHGVCCVRVPARVRFSADLHSRIPLVRTPARYNRAGLRPTLSYRLTL